IGHRGDLDGTVHAAGKLERFTHERVLDLIYRLYPLQLRILDDDLRYENLMQRDVDILVDRRGDEEAAVLTIVGREIRPSAAERDAQGRARDDHRQSGSELR